jgi:putative peptide maturation system protein
LPTLATSFSQETFESEQHVSDLSAVVVATIDGSALSLREFLRALMAKGELQPLIEEAIQTALIATAAKREGLTVSEGELQRAADDYRRSLGLHKAAGTQNWLRQNHLTIEDLESSLERTLLTQKLANRVTRGQVEKHFAQNAGHYDQAELAHIVVRNEGMANELLSKIRDDELSFAELAREYSIDAQSKDVGGSLGLVSRSTLNPAVASAVFAAHDGDVVGPVKTDMGFHLVKVKAIRRAQLNADTAATIRQELFGDWLQDQARKARVEVPLYECI